MKAVVICVENYFTLLQNSTNNISSWVSIHIEELTFPQLVMKFPKIYKAQRFISISSTAWHFSLC